MYSTGLSAVPQTGAAVPTSNFDRWLYSVLPDTVLGTVCTNPAAEIPGSVCHTYGLNRDRVYTLPPQPTPTTPQGWETGVVQRPGETPENVIDRLIADSQAAQAAAFARTMESVNDGITAYYERRAAEQAAAVNTGIDLGKYALWGVGALAVLLVVGGVGRR